MFPQAANLAIEATLDERSRIIIVEDKRYVSVPGLASIERITIDGVAMELESSRNYTKQDPGHEPETVQIPVPLVQLSEVEGLGTVLLRAEFSNDGEWQVGSRLVVTGEWTEPIETFVSSKDVDERDARIAKLEKELAEAKKPAKPEPKSEAKKPAK